MLMMDIFYDTPLSLKLYEYLTLEDNKLRKLIKLPLMRVWKPNTSVNEIEINDSSGYPPNKYLHDDDPSIQYQANSDISYYITSHNRSLPNPLKFKLMSESPIIHHASTSSNPAPQDRWSRDQHIELVNIIGGTLEGMWMHDRAVDKLLCIILGGLWVVYGQEGRFDVVVGYGFQQNKFVRGSVHTRQGGINKAQLQGISSQHNGVNIKESLHA
ncbi:hypothetical protein Tco_0762934 [Tanacetum coccineum]